MFEEEPEDVEMQIDSSTKKQTFQKNKRPKFEDSGKEYSKRP